MYSNIEVSGYSVCNSLNIYEFELIYSQIDKQWREVIAKNTPDLFKQIVDRSLSIDDYHLLDADSVHSALWPKSNRILPYQSAEMILSTCFLSDLAESLGEFTISDEEQLGFPNLYWRIVRPYKHDDIGPAHRDSWFWALNPNFAQQISYKHRLKVWIAICTIPELSGLLVSPSSHLDPSIKYVCEQRHGIMKPLLSDPKREYGLQLLNLKPGQAVVFHDDLLHAGALNRSVKTRVSLEFTLLIH